VAAAGLVAVCLLLALLLVAFQSVAPGSRLPIGYRVFACLDVRSSFGLTVSLSWLAPELRSAIGPLAPNCVYLPWLPALPPSGHYEFRFPP
jgi:hypothetical protein